MGSYLRIRSGGGLGDALYLQSIVRELVSRGTSLEVCTNYPELFRFPVKFAPFSRENINIVAHYSMRREQKSKQWDDIQTQAKVEAELRIDWTPKTKSIKTNKPIAFIHGGRQPMDRTDGFGKVLLPDGVVFNDVLQKLRETYYTVYCGRSDRVFHIEVDLDLNNKTDIVEMMDIASISDVFYGQCSFIVPLAESFDKPLLCMWSKRGLHSTHPVLKTITPEKILYKETSRYVLDEAPDETIIDEFCNFRRYQEAV